MKSINTQSSTLLHLAQDDNFVLRFSAGSQRFECLVREIDHRRLKVMFSSSVPKELTEGSTLMRVVLHSVSHERDTVLNLKVIAQIHRAHGGFFILLEPSDEKSRAQLWTLLIEIRGVDFGPERSSGPLS